MARFVVTEIEGYFNMGGGNGSRGLSAHVIDTAVNHRCVFTARTENIGASVKGDHGTLTQWERQERVRGLARARAMELNAR